MHEYKAEITTGPDSVDTDSENEELVLEATNSLLPEQDLWGPEFTKAGAEMNILWRYVLTWLGRRCQSDLNFEVDSNIRECQQSPVP